MQINNSQAKITLRDIYFQLSRKLNSCIFKFCIFFWKIYIFFSFIVFSLLGWEIWFVYKLIQFICPNVQPRGPLD